MVSVKQQIARPAPHLPHALLDLPLAGTVSKASKTAPDQTANPSRTRDLGTRPTSNGLDFPHPLTPEDSVLRLRGYARPVRAEKAAPVSVRIEA